MASCIRRAGGKHHCRQTNRGWHKGSRRPRRSGFSPRFEQLEDRRLLAIAPSLAGTDVTFTGDLLSDTLTLRVNAAGQIEFDVNGGGFSNDLDGAGGTLLIADATSVLATLGDGDDALVIDNTGAGGLFGNAAGLLIAYDGGAGLEVLGDKLDLVGGTVAEVVHTFTGSESGSVAVNDPINIATIGYADVEPITDSMGATDRTFTVGIAGAQTIRLMDTGGPDGMSTIDSNLTGAFESVTFANPTFSLTVNAGDGDDTVQFVSVDAANAPDVLLNGQLGEDTFEVAPSTTSELFIDGGTPSLPTIPGDTLDLDLTGVLAPVVIPTGAGSGMLVSSSHATVNWTEIETLDASGPPLVIRVDANADPGGDNVANNGAADTFELVRSGPLGVFLDIYINGDLAMRSIFAAVLSVTVNGSDDDDTLTVDHSGGLVSVNPFLPGGGIFYDGEGVSVLGNSGAAGDLLVIEGADPAMPIATEVYVATGPDSGVVVQDPDAGALVPVPLPVGGLSGNEVHISFTNLSPVVSTTPAAAFDIFLTGADDDATIADADIPPGGTADCPAGCDAIIVSGATFESYTFANKTSVTINGLDGSDSFTLTDTDGADGLATLRVFGNELTNGTLESDDGGGETFDVLATAPGVFYELHGQGGGDTATIGNTFANFLLGLGVAGGSLDDILGPVDFVPDSPGGPFAVFDQLLVDDSFDPDADLAAAITNFPGTGFYSVHQTRLSGFAPATISYSFDDGDGLNLEFLTVRASEGGNTIAINDTTAIFATAVDAGTGDDANTVTINGDGLSGFNVFTGNTGNDRFVLNIFGDLGAAAVFPIFGLTIRGDAPAGDSANRDLVEINDLAPVFGLGGDSSNNLVTIDTATGAATPVGPLGTVSLSDGGIDFDAAGTLWGIEDDDTIFRINPATGQATIVSFTSGGFEGLAIADFAVGVGFSVQSDGDDQLYSIDLLTGVATAIGPVGFADVESLSFDAFGTLYGVDDVTDQLITIDPTTGAGTVVGSLGVSTIDQGLTFDNLGNLWMSTDAPSPETFYSVDPFTGAATAVGPQGQDVTGLAAASAPLKARSLTFTYLTAAAGNLDITGFAIPINLRTTETAIYNGDAANDDSLLLVGTAGDDDLTVAPLTLNSGVAFLGGDPWDGPCEGGDLPGFLDNLPGVAGGSNGPDVFFGGISPFTLTVAGGGSVDGDQLYVYGPNEVDLVDPAAAAAGVDIFGFGPGVLIPGFGSGGAYDDVIVTDFLVEFVNNSLGLLLPVNIFTPSFVQAPGFELIPGLIVNTGFEALPGPGAVADDVEAALSFNFALRINGGDPAPAFAPAGDRLQVMTPGEVNIYSDKCDPPIVTITSSDPVTGTPTFGLGFSSFERVDLTPGPTSQTVNIIGDNNDPAVDQNDNYVVLGTDVDSLLPALATLPPILGVGFNPTGMPIHPDFEPDTDGDNEFFLEINGSAPIGFRNVVFLNAFGDDQNPPPGTPSVGPNDIDRLEVTPYADNTPTGWGIHVNFDEGNPTLDGIDAPDLLVVNGVAGVSEKTTVQPTGPGTGQVVVNNDATGTPIVVINYTTNTAIEVHGNGGVSGDSDKLLLRGTDGTKVGLSGDETVDADFTAAGTAGAPKVSVSDTDTLAVIYELIDLSGISVVNFALDDGDDTIAVVGTPLGPGRITTINVDAGDGVDKIEITPSTGTAFFVNGGPPGVSDMLDVIDPVGGSRIELRLSLNPNSGSVTVIPPGGPALKRISYEGIETLHPDLAGNPNLLVLKPDPFEPNNTRATAWYLGAGAAINVDPNIDPAGDVDFYRFVAAQTGALDFQVYFSHSFGNLDIEVRDSSGDLMASSTSTDDDERIAIGAVRNQTYYLRVFGATGTEVNVYNFTVINVPAPVPQLVDLQAASDSGRSDSDNVTNDTTTTYDIVLDDDRTDEFSLLDLSPDTTDDDAQTAVFDYGVEVFNNGVSIGFAFLASGNTWRFTATVGDLSEGHNNFISAAVWIRDRAIPAVIGRGELSQALQVTLDTIAPANPTIFIDPATSDTGVPGQQFTLSDEITSDSSTGFTGRAEADAIVRLWADGEPISSGVVDASDVFQGLTVAVPLDGDEAFANGQWNLAGRFDLNDPSVGFPLDGRRQITATAQDLAGNESSRSTPAVLEIFIDTQGPRVTDVFLPVDPDFDLFDPKPSAGPTPLTNQLTVKFTDLPFRIQQFLYPAVNEDVAKVVGNYQLVGDHVGNILITDILFNDTTTPGSGGGGGSGSGAVVIDGGDRDDHGFVSAGPDGTLGTPDDVNSDGWKFIEQMVQFAHAGALNGAATDVLIVGVTGGGALDAITSVATVLGLSTTIVTGAAIDTVTFTDFKVMYVPSDESNTGGGISDSDLAKLTTRKADVQAFVNNGGSLVALTEGSAAAPYAWLELPDPFTITSFGGGGVTFPLAKTPEAIAAGFTISDAELSAGVPYHNEFTGPAGFNGLQPFVLDSLSRVITLGLASGSSGIGGGMVMTEVTLVFAEFLPDDRYTLTVRDNIVDDAGNRLDGESQAPSPFEDQSAIFPTGDGQPGGNLVARFTIDSRPEIGVYSGGSVALDANGNFIFDPEGLNNDKVNVDLVFNLGFDSDRLFAGNFPSFGVADGFDKLGAYGFVSGSWRWLIDTNSDGRIIPADGDRDLVNPIAIDGLPVAGNFDGDLANGDEVGVFDSVTWWLDVNADGVVDGTDVALGGAITGTLRGLPIVGDFDGDGRDDLATWSLDRFYFDLAADGLDGSADATIDFGFSGVLERPVAADMDGDGIDDVGLWVPGRSHSLPSTAAEWYFLISDDHDPADGTNDRVIGTVNTLDHPFSPIPFTADKFAQFGDEFALPILGNFDPPMNGGPVVGGWIDSLYTDILGRDPSFDEWKWWSEAVEDGMTYRQVAEGFMYSTERRAAIIDDLYQQYLGRASDAGGLNYWIGVWDANRGPEQVQAGIIGSAEYYQTAGGSDAAWVTALYRNILGRSVDQPGLDFWVNYIQTNTKESVVLGFVTSDEYRLGLITGWYQDYLGRTIDQGGAQYWLTQMKLGMTQEELQIGILGSSEYRLRA